MRTYQRFYQVFLLATLFSVVAIASFNLAVDPYGVLNTPTLAVFNQLKPEKIWHDRLFKAVDLTYIKPDVILVGTSRVQWGLDPQHPAFHNHKVYNLGLQGSNMYELRRYIEHAITNQPNLKQIVVGLDLLSFCQTENKPDFTESRLDKKSLTIQDTLPILFSFDALDSAITTIKQNIINPINYYGNFQDNGMIALDERIKIPGSLENFAFWIVFDFKHKHRTEKVADENLEHFKQVVKLAQKKGIELKLFISPEHATNLERLRLASNWQNFEQWKRNIVKIALEGGFQVWDFSGFNSITTEAIKTEMKRYKDSSHYQVNVGNLVLNRLFQYQAQTVPEDFGILITPDNIEYHLAKILADRDAWSKKQPDDAKFILSICDRSR